MTKRSHLTSAVLQPGLREVLKDGVRKILQLHVAHTSEETNPTASLRRDLSHKGRMINLIHLELTKAFDMENHQLRQRAWALPEALFMRKHLM